MKILKKLKSIFFAPKRKQGNIVIYLLDKETSKIHSQEIYGITIFANRKDMTGYISSTVMTTSPSHIRLLDYAEMNEK
tara:strand:+ start:207 stop:440 length:234 start_codon:yes stop_codon:yes gene_type:complete